jgi:hypothetical protein
MISNNKCYPFTTSKQIHKWLQTQTKTLIVDVCMANNYLRVYWGKNTPHLTKIPLPGGVIYCLKEEDFTNLIDEMNKDYSYLRIN